MLNAPVPGLFLCVDMDGVDIERSGIAAFSAPPFVRTVYCVTEIVILPGFSPAGLATGIKLLGLKKM
jgi:hypothetical protein